MLKFKKNAFKKCDKLSWIFNFVGLVKKKFVASTLTQDISNFFLDSKRVVFVTSFKFYFLALAIINRKTYHGLTIATTCSRLSITDASECRRCFTIRDSYWHCLVGAALNLLKHPVRLLLAGVGGGVPAAGCPGAADLLAGSWQPGRLDTSRAVTGPATLGLDHLDKLLKVSTGVLDWGAWERHPGALLIWNL